MNTGQERPCHKCSEKKGKGDYSKTQWKKKDSVRRCNDCIRKNDDSASEQQQLRQQPLSMSPSSSSSSSSNSNNSDSDSAYPPAKKRKVTHEPTPQDVLQIVLTNKAKQDKINAEQARNIAELRRTRTSKGAVTQAQFVADLGEDGLFRSCNQADVWGKSTAWPLKGTPTVPDAGALEVAKENKILSKKCVQGVVSKILENLSIHNNTNAKKWKSLPDPQAYNKKSFRTRMPDIVNYKVGLTGALGITSFGDLKRRGEGDFTAEQIGHVLDMARSFMEHVGMYRPFLIVFLSDGKRWQFFRVSRTDDDNLLYKHAPVISDSTVGWKHYVALLSSKIADLGYAEPIIQNVSLEAPLGRGGSAVVYRGSYKEQVVLVKVFSNVRKSSFIAEHQALKMLLNMEGVPQLEDVLQLSNPSEGMYEKAIVVTPMGLVFAPRAEGKSANGEHLGQLVDIVQKTHAKGLVHRDIKPDNVYRVGNSMLLNDWSSASTNTSTAKWAGTVGFGVSDAERDFQELSVKAHDLVGVVRTAYCLVFVNELPPHNSKEDAEAFWNDRLRSGTIWETALAQGKAEDYDALKKTLKQLK